MTPTRSSMKSIPIEAPRILSVGTANPPNKYTQEELLEYYQETDWKIRSIFLGGHISTRHLYLPEPVNGMMPDESNEELIQKHLRGCLEIGSQAINECLEPLGLAPYNIDFICCLSSTGFLCPGITAHLIKKMGFRENVRRADILGMGCNAGINGLQAVTDFANANPGKHALLVCIEICSAAYVYNKNINTAVVNSLFGDGAAAIVVCRDSRLTWKDGPRVLDFEPHIIPDAIDAMRFDLEDNKLSFYLDRDIPYVIGMNVLKPISRLLGRHQIKKRHIQHWLVHSGGKKVIDAIAYNLGLTRHDLRHTIHVLKNFGNLSSASFLFSYKELCEETSFQEADQAVMITMGPGTSIETALLQW